MRSISNQILVKKEKKKPQSIAYGIDFAAGTKIGNSTFG